MDAMGSISSLSSLNKQDQALALSFIALLLSGLAAILVWRTPSQSRKKVPVFGQGTEDLTHPLLDGYNKHPHSVFELATSDFPTLIVPRRIIREIGSMPEKSLSLDREVYERLMGKYTRLVKSSHFTNFVKLRILKNPKKAVKLLQEEAEWALDVSVGDVDDWKPGNVSQIVLKVVSLQLGHSFVGYPLCRDQNWMKLAIQYAMKTVAVANKMMSYHWLQRPFIAWFTPEIAQLRSQFKEASVLLEHFLKKRLEQCSDPGFEKPDDLMQWLIESILEQRGDLQLHTGIQMEAVQAGTFNLSFQLINTLYDLMAYPQQFVQVLKELDEICPKSKPLNLENISKLWKMDSFMKESQRMGAMSLVTMRRFILRPMTLSDGTTLSSGCSVAAPTQAVNLDPSVWDKPHEFDGFRFEKLRESEGKNAFQFSSSSASELNWGYGIHACPGRHYASIQLKILLITLLRRYEIKFAGDRSERPVNQCNGVLNGPDPAVMALFKSRKGDKSE